MFMRIVDIHETTHLINLQTIDTITEDKQGEGENYWIVNTNTLQIIVTLQECIKIQTNLKIIGD